MEVQEPGENGKKSSSDEESMEEDDTEVLKQIDELDTQIAASPYNYKNQVDRIGLLRKSGEFERLRNARKDMSKIFPLTKELWLQWLEDEQKFAESEEDHMHLEELFELSTKDYLSPEIWLEYAQYSIRLIGNEGGIAKLRARMEKALSEVGLHASKGSSVWEAYREIENAILMTMQPQPGSISTAEEVNKLSEQTERVGSLFLRQLAIPLLDMENTMSEYVEWRKSVEDGEIPSDVLQKYKSNLVTLEKLLKMESELEAAEMPKLEVYYRYIELEQETSDPARIQCIYERAIADNCLNSDLWLQYIKYLSATIKSGPVVLSANERAVRNCPWTAQLWEKYLICLEKNKATAEQMESVRNEALAAGFSSAGDYALLWQTCCDQARRRFTGCGEEEREAAGKALSDVFEAATTHLINTVLPAFGETGDPDSTLWCYWARCEARHLRDVDRAREIFDDLLSDVETRRKWGVWLQYYRLEMEGGDVKKARTVLKRALQSTAADDGSAESAAAQLIQFEREMGSLDDLEDAHRKVDGRLAKVAKRKEKVAAHFQSKGKRRQQAPQGGRREKTSPKSEAKKRHSAPTPDSVPEKRQKRAEQKDENRSKEKDAFKAPSTLPVRFVKPKPKVQGTGDAEQPRATTKTAPPGFAPPAVGKKYKSDSETTVQKATVDSEKGQSEKFERTAETDERTVFVSNLGYLVENLEEKLRKIFSACGAVESVRLAKSNKGKIRGFAYVQFADKSSIEEALKLDRQALEGRPMFVSPNVDKSKQPDFKVFKYDTGMERHKLFVSGLSFATSEDRLREIFAPHGELRSLRIVTARSGKPKGLAYVEYANEADAAQAVIKTDQTVVDGFTIKVAISNPPARNRAKEDRAKQGGSAVRGGARGRGRTQVSLLPRSLQRHPAEHDGAKAERDANDNEVKGKALSNRDFAKMFVTP